MEPAAKILIVGAMANLLLRPWASAWPRGSGAEGRITVYTAGVSFILVIVSLVILSVGVVRGL